jgi:hypothetical protein
LGGLSASGADRTTWPQRNLFSHTIDVVLRLLPKGSAICISDVLKR